MSRADEARLIAGVVARLRDEFPDQAGEAIGVRVRRAYRSFEHARIRDFIPVLVTREVRSDLRGPGRADVLAEQLGNAVTGPAGVAAARRLAGRCCTI
jgi:hypothetical protein